ncbi:MAG: GNAT family N-acetyltransferase [Gemmatimonadota bacterium]
MPRWTLARLHADHPVGSFTCGELDGAKEVDAYLRGSALHEQAQRLAAAWIIEDREAKEESARIVGFFSLSPVSVRIAPHVLEANNLDVPYAQIGGWLLGRMGVATRHQGHNVGAALVAEATRQARRFQDTTAGVFLVVDPKNDRLLAWYEALEFGFRRADPVNPKHRRLILKL